MSKHTCPFCLNSVGLYADIDGCQTLVGGIILISFWLCDTCHKATATDPNILANLSTSKISKIAESFAGRGYTLREVKTFLV